MIDLFSKDFDLMCFVQDKKVQTGICKYDDVIQEFGEKLVKNCIYEKKIIYHDKNKTGGIFWTDLGRKRMNF
jgi:hypothetical protein